MVDIWATEIWHNNLSRIYVYIFIFGLTALKMISFTISLQCQLTSNDYMYTYAYDFLRLSSFSPFRTTNFVSCSLSLPLTMSFSSSPLPVLCISRAYAPDASSFMANLALPFLFFFSYYLSHVSILPHLAFVISIWLFSSPALLKYSAGTFILICL